MSHRDRYPNSPILIQKIANPPRGDDISTGEHSLSVSAFGSLLHSSLSDFGGAPCPYEWSVISETTADLENAIRLIADLGVTKSPEM